MKTPIPRVIPVLAAALLAVAAACDEDPPTTPDVEVARVRVVHALTDGPALDVRLDTAASQVAVPALAPGTASPYALLAPGTARHVVVSPAGTQTVILDTTARVDFAREHSIVVAGRATGTPARTMFVLTDNNTAPGRDSVRVRFVHAAASAANLDVYVTAPTAALPTAVTTANANVSFRSASGYTAGRAGQFRLRAYPPGTRATPTLDFTTPALTAANVVTLLFVDPPAGTTAARVLVLVDRVQ